MQIRRYEAMSMQEAIKLVKEDLGQDAIILSTRKVRGEEGSINLKGGQFVEVTAALDQHRVEAKRRPDEGRTQRAISWGFEELLYPIKEEIQQLREELSHSPILDQRFLYTMGEWDELRYLLKYMRNQLATEADLKINPQLIPFYQRLIEQEVKHPYALRVIGSIGNSSSAAVGDKRDKILRELSEILGQLIKVSGPLKLEQGMAKVAAFVGPTGVGKTTTIAKLAAHYALREKKKVALVTLDTYRIAAVEQLKVYAKIIDVPVKVILYPEELEAVLREYSSKDLVLIDSAGRSQNDGNRLAELRDFLHQVSSLETHLLMSANTKVADLDEIARRFEAVGFDHLIFTKLDESRSYGGILNQVIQTEKPISYVTIGQRVPEDIEVGCKERIAGIILGQRSYYQEGH